MPYTFIEHLMGSDLWFLRWMQTNLTYNISCFWVVSNVFFFFSWMSCNGSAKCFACSGMEYLHKVGSKPHEQFTQILIVSIDLTCTQFQMTWLLLLGLWLYSLGTDPVDLWLTTWTCQLWSTCNWTCKHWLVTHLSISL